MNNLSEPETYFMLLSEQEKISRVPSRYQANFKIMLDILNRLKTDFPEYSFALGFFISQNNAVRESPAYVEKHHSNFYCFVVSTLILDSKLSYDELYALLAHEMGHVVAGHLNKSFIWHSFLYDISQFMIYLNLMTTIYTFFCDENPFICLMVQCIEFYVFFSLLNHISHEFKMKEFDADWIAVDYFNSSPLTFVKTLTKIENMVLVQDKQNKFVKFPFSLNSIFNTHPTVEERICRVLQNSV